MKKIILCCALLPLIGEARAAMPDSTRLIKIVQQTSATGLAGNPEKQMSYSTMGLADSMLADNNVREKIMRDIQQNLDRRNKAFDSTMLKLDNRVGKLDSLLRMTGSPRERLERLVERVQVLEEKQKAVEQNELNVYEANYQSAVINLASMDREIKPLILFHATKDFFNTLTETSNPFSYDDFRAGFEKFRVYIDKVKDHDATQKAVADVIDATGDVTLGVPIVGAYSQLMFSAMAGYVNSIGHGKRELKKEAENMFSVTAALSQFTTDRNLIENEWDGITGSLEEMQIYYDSTLDRNLRMLSIDRSEITNDFTRQSDASKRYLYLTTLRKKAGEYVRNMKAQDPKDWKENIYYQLMDVQNLKVHYGDITYRVKHHINKYSTLISKYKSNKEIGSHMSTLDDKLTQLKSTFDDAFEPTQYVHSASQMYKVL
jgi:hypothetical protein